MRNKKYPVYLKKEERTELKEMTAKGKAAAYQIRHANILLQTDEGGPAWKDAQVAETFRVNINTVGAVRRRYVEGGLHAAINRKEQDSPSHEPIFDGQKEAQLIALGCSAPPEGHGRWTLRLLANKSVELHIVPKTSYETVRRVLKKTNSSRICAGRG